MDGVNRYAFFAYIDEGDNAEFDYHIESDGSWVKASDYEQLKAANYLQEVRLKDAAEAIDQLKAEKKRLAAMLNRVVAEGILMADERDICEHLANENVEFKLMIFNLRKQIDEARELLGEYFRYADVHDDRVTNWLEASKS